MGEISLKVQTLAKGKNDLWLNLRPSGSIHVIIEAIGFGTDGKNTVEYDQKEGKKGVLKDVKQGIREGGDELRYISNLTYSLRYFGDSITGIFK